MGIILQTGEVARDLRKRLWSLHTKKNAAANPDEMHDYNVAVNAFYVWGRLIKNNLDEKRKGNKKPLYPLRQFFRSNPTVSRKD